MIMLAAIPAILSGGAAVAAILGCVISIWRFCADSAPAFFSWVRDQVAKWKAYSIGGFAVVAAWVLDKLSDLVSSAIVSVSRWVGTFPALSFVDDMPSWGVWIMSECFDWNAFVSAISAVLVAYVAALTARAGFAAVKLAIELL